MKLKDFTIFWKKRRLAITSDSQASGKHTPVGCLWRLWRWLVVIMVLSLLPTTLGDSGHYGAPPRGLSRAQLWFVEDLKTAGAHCNTTHIVCVARPTSVSPRQLVGMTDSGSLAPVETILPLKTGATCNTTHIVCVVRPTSVSSRQLVGVSDSGSLAPVYGPTSVSP